MPTEQERWEKALGLSGMRPAQTTSQVQDPREREAVAHKKLWESAGGKTPGDIGEQRRLKAERYREGAKARWAKAIGVDRTDPSQQRQPMRVHTRETVTEAREKRDTIAFERQKELMRLGAGYQETAAEKAAGRRTEAGKAKAGYGKEEREDIQEWKTAEAKQDRDLTDSLTKLRHKLGTKQLAETVRYHDAVILRQKDEMAQAINLAEMVSADRQKKMVADTSIDMMRGYQSQYATLGQRLKMLERELSVPVKDLPEGRRPEIKTTIAEINKAIGNILKGMRAERVRLVKLTEGAEAPDGFASIKAKVQEGEEFDPKAFEGLTPEQKTEIKAIREGQKTKQVAKK